MTKVSKKKSLYKSTGDRVFTGVAAGIADYINVESNVIRVLFVLLTLASGLGLIFYITLSILLPTEDEVTEREDMEFYYNATHGGILNIDPSKNMNLIQSLLSKQNILSLIIICTGSIILQFNIVPWELISDTLTYPAIVFTIGFAFVLKSITVKK
jgi:phage shock protein C